MRKRPNKKYCKKIVFLLSTRSIMPTSSIICFSTSLAPHKTIGTYDASKYIFILKLSNSKFKIQKKKKKCNKCLTPVPGCADAPTKYKFLKRWLRVPGRKCNTWVMLCDRPRIEPFHKLNWSLEKKRQTIRLLFSLIFWCKLIATLKSKEK